MANDTARPYTIWLRDLGASRPGRTTVSPLPVRSAPGASLEMLAVALLLVLLGVLGVLFWLGARALPQTAPSAS